MRRGFTAFFARAVSCGVSAAQWSEVTPGVWRTDSLPHGYALISERHCVLLGAPVEVTPEALPPSVEGCDLVLLTHQHRDSCANAALFVRATIPVRAPKL